MKTKVNVIFCLCFMGSVASSFAQAPSWAEDEAWLMEDIEIVLYRPGSVLALGAPRYRVIIKGDGSVIIDLGHGTKSNGSVLSSTVSEKEIREIVDDLLAEQFFQLPDKYRGGARLFRVPKPGEDYFLISELSGFDQPFFEIGLTIGSHTKKIVLFSDYGPKGLFDAAKKIDALTGADKLEAGSRNLGDITSFNLTIRFIEMRAPESGEVHSLKSYFNQEEEDYSLQSSLIDELKSTGKTYSEGSGAEVMYRVFGQKISAKKGSPLISYFIEIRIAEYDYRFEHDYADEDMLTIDHHRNAITGASSLNNIRSAIERDCIELLQAAFRSHVDE